jgi:hypothetical protein
MMDNLASASQDAMHTIVKTFLVEKRVAELITGLAARPTAVFSVV